jgi:hypothetical protein
MGGGAVGGAMQGYVADAGRMAIERLTKMIDAWREEKRHPATVPQEVHA